MRPTDTTFRSVLPTLVADALSELPEVVAVVMAGSQEAGGMDGHSDIDLYVYSATPVDLTRRSAIAVRFATRREVGNDVWEPGDEWVHALTGSVVDLMYRSPAWIERELDRVLIRHQATVGYSTCFWHNVLHSVALLDRGGWYRRLQAAASVPYPEPLRRAIIAKNHPILRQTLSSYLHQIELAVRREDQISLQHRVTALLASYFDVLFALNRLPHPGEKRLLEFATTHCAILPHDFKRRVHDLLAAAPGPAVIRHIGSLVDDLDRLVAAEQAPPPAPEVPRPAVADLDRAWRDWVPSQPDQIALPSS
ncbi:MAG: DUF4037 domain-containing protein [Chloroflexota bacterium]|nr:DUF4037 domain-containing protein [Chloroflexota bacterium]